MSEWRVGDLCRVDGQGQTQFVVTDAGMGSPRTGMKMKAVVGPRRFEGIVESSISRPSIQRGDWIRKAHGPNQYRRRVAAVDGGCVILDLEEHPYKRMETVFCRMPMGGWVPVEAPEHQPAGGHMIPVVEAERLLNERDKEIERLKSLYKDICEECEGRRSECETLQLQKTSLEVEVKSLTRNFMGEIEKCNGLRESYQRLHQTLEDLRECYDARLKQNMALVKEVQKLREEIARHTQTYNAKPRVLKSSGPVVM